MLFVEREKIEIFFVRSIHFFLGPTKNWSLEKTRWKDGLICFRKLPLLQASFCYHPFVSFSSFVCLWLLCSGKDRKVTC